ncbi:MAG: hypothetical protein ACFC1C_01690 [Candidatus Malihini olakiniferum]
MITVDTMQPFLIKLIHINEFSVLAPDSTLHAEDAARLRIDRHRCLHNLAALQKRIEVRKKVVAL